MLVTDLVYTVYNKFPLKTKLFGGVFPQLFTLVVFWVKNDQPTKKLLSLYAILLPKLVLYFFLEFTDRRPYTTFSVDIPKIIHKK